MSDIHQNHFTTYDIFLSSTLVTLGFKVEALDKKNRRKVEFFFLRENGIDEAIQGYWARSLRIEPQAFAASLKSLKNRIYSD